MTKEEFLKRVNKSRYPKYKIGEVGSGIPPKEGAYIVCTMSDKILLAVYDDGKWEQSCFTSACEARYPSQEIYHVPIKEKIKWWV